MKFAQESFFFIFDRHVFFNGAISCCDYVASVINEEKITICQWRNGNEWKIVNDSQTVLSESCYIHNTFNGKHRDHNEDSMVTDGLPIHLTFF